MAASAKITYGPQIAIVGAGPRGTSILERISASATRFISSDSWLTIHLIDQFPPGAGKVWRADQSRLLWMNTVASQVTLFTDESVKCDGPIVKGPTLHEWLARNEHRLGPNDFATRVQCGTYLRWVYDHVIERLPSNVRVKLHVAEAQSIEHIDSSLCNLTLSTGQIQNLSAVILAQGHLPGQLAGDELTRKNDFAAKQVAAKQGPALTYIPPGNASDADLSRIKPNDKVLLIGMGLSFFDYLNLLTEGLGGEYVRENCVLTYKSSGREPKMNAGNRLQPRVLTETVIAEFRTAEKKKDFKDLWALISLEVEIVYYVTLLRARDEPTTAFEEQFLACSEEKKKKEILANYGIAQEEWWDWKEVIYPHHKGITPPLTKDKWETWVLKYLKDDVRQAQLGNVHGPHAAARSVLRDFRDVLRLIVDYRGITDVEERLHREFASLNSFLSIGPPLERIEQMIALVDAKILTVLAPADDMKLTLGSAGWSIKSDKSPGLYSDDKMATLIESRMQKPTVTATNDELLKKLASNGMCCAHKNASYLTEGLDITQKPYNILDAKGKANPTLFAVGIPTKGVRWITTTLPSPSRNSVELLATDGVARGALRKAQKDLKEGRVVD